jgi:hypothetical protein
MKAHSSITNIKNMKYAHKNITGHLSYTGSYACVFFFCKVEPILDPNNPGIGTISANPTVGEIQNLVTAIESGMRDNMNFYFDDAGVIGREFYRFSTSDPRFTSDLLGKGTAVLDNNTFYITNPFAASTVL